MAQPALRYRMIFFRCLGQMNDRQRGIVTVAMRHQVDACEIQALMQMRQRPISFLEKHNGVQASVGAGGAFTAQNVPITTSGAPSFTVMTLSATASLTSPLAVGTIIQDRPPALIFDSHNSEWTDHTLDPDPEFNRHQRFQQLINWRRGDHLELKKYNDRRGRSSWNLVVYPQGYFWTDKTETLNHDSSGYGTHHLTTTTTSLHWFYQYIAAQENRDVTTTGPRRLTKSGPTVFELNEILAL